MPSNHHPSYYRNAVYRFIYQYPKSPSIAVYYYTTP